MNFEKLLVIVVLCLTITTVSAQSKKDIRENKITSETSNITTIENGKEVTYKDSYIVYDKNGNVTEETEYNKDGTIKRKVTNKYNVNKDKAEEVVFDGKDKTTRKTTFYYNANGQKIGEIEYDGAGKILKQSMITYNANGFKTEKKTYDANKKLISTKKFTYSK
jgi:hypothetical protein